MLDLNYFVFDENGNVVNGLLMMVLISVLDVMMIMDGVFGIIFDIEVNVYCVMVVLQEFIVEELFMVVMLMDIDFCGMIDLLGQIGKGINVQVQDGSVLFNGDVGFKLIDVQV